jgi:hypothetical protein
MEKDKLANLVDAVIDSATAMGVHPYTGYSESKVEKTSV